MKMPRQRMVSSTIVIFLALFMLLSLHGPSPSKGSNENLKDAYEIEHTSRTHKISLRLHTSHPGKLVIDKIPLPAGAVSLAALTLLAVPRVSFRPLFYFLLKRIRLMPIKFTSMFVA